MPATRAELKAHLAGHGVVVEGQAIVHLLARAAMQGRIVMDTERVFVPLSLPAPVRSRGRAGRAGPPLRRVATRARPRDDLAYWSGLPLRDCREPGPCAVDDGPVPRVELPAFDELLLGWRDRSPTVPPALAPRSTRAAGSSGP